MNNAEPKPHRPRNAVLDLLSTSFPIFRECRPLAIGIHKAIKERLPDIDSQQLRLAMRAHTASTRYLKALTQADARFDLDGNPAGEVSAEQKKQASDTLRERFREQAERHKAAQLEQQRKEKLSKLAEKFNSR
jgi:ProP effector